MKLRQKVKACLYWEWYRKKDKIYIRTGPCCGIQIKGLTKKELDILHDQATAGWNNTPCYAGGWSASKRDRKKLLIWAKKKLAT